MNIFTIFIAAALVNNVILAQFLGICPFLGVSKKVDTAKGMGLAVTFVMLLASTLSYLVYKFILHPLNIEYLYTIAFILVIASLVQLVEVIIKKMNPALYKSLGIFLPLITTNCAVLGVAITNMDKEYNLIQAIINSLGTALGFTLSIVLLASIRERMEENTNMPEALKGLPITLITAGLMSIAFLGFNGLV
jgi:H+/Na+-translocating ferredoxin:NAD+ oxidoreductase subunit A